MGRDQELKWLAFSLYPLSCFLYSPLNLLFYLVSDEDEFNSTRLLPIQLESVDQLLCPAEVVYTELEELQNHSSESSGSRENSTRLSHVSEYSETSPRPGSETSRGTENSTRLNHVSEYSETNPRPGSQKKIILEERFNQGNKIYLHL